MTSKAFLSLNPEKSAVPFRCLITGFGLLDFLTLLLVSFPIIHGKETIGVTALIGVVIGVVLILSQPRVTNVEKSIIIQASPEDIARETESFQSFNAWSPWNKATPEVHYTIVTFEGFARTFYSDIKLEPQGNSTKVTWIYDGYNNTFKEKAIWVLTKSDLKEQYEEGLATLKEIVERKVRERSTGGEDSLRGH